MQMDLFSIDSVEVVIPKEVISPLESNRRLTSNAFKEEKETFVSYVRAIQEYHKCSWFEARKLFFEYRDKQKPIKVQKEELK